MNSANFSKGDILEATHRELKKGYHYIVYYEGHSNLSFCGCMITHSNDSKNTPMEAQYFETNDDNGNPYKIGYDNTYLVKGKFLKSEEWGPYEKVGALTATGIDYLDEMVSGLNSETFSDYYRRNKLTP